MGWGRRLAITILLLVISGVAMAEPAVNAGYVPIATAGAGEEHSVVVETGDHLWKISQTHLDGRLGRRATVDEVTAYWRQVIELNRERLRSGDPDLIYPGEVVSLPVAR